MGASNSSIADVVSPAQGRNLTCLKGKQTGKVSRWICGNLEVGKSEGRAVMVRIRILNLSGAKAGGRAAGSSVRDSLENLWRRESK